MISSIVLLAKTAQKIIIRCVSLENYLQSTFFPPFFESLKRQMGKRQTFYRKINIVPLKSLTYMSTPLDTLLATFKKHFFSRNCSREKTEREMMINVSDYQQADLLLNLPCSSCLGEMNQITDAKVDCCWRWGNYLHAMKFNQRIYECN